jgi:bilirubin oxidase
MKILLLSALPLILLTTGCATAQTTYNPLWIPDTLTGTTFNLTLAPSTAQLRDGDATNTYSYNGEAFWGPTLIMNKGDVVQMNVTNNLSEDTTTHWHGFHIPPATDGGPHQVIAAGDTWSPSFEIKNSAAMYWYHPHLHEKTAEQLTMGAGGLIIIKDDEEAALPLPRTYGVDDIPLVFTSRRFLSGGNQFDTSTAISPYGDYELTNGVMNAQVDLPAQFVRLRVLNAEIERAYNLGFSDGRTFYIIGNDSGLLNAPVPVTRAKLFVGERLEILVDLSQDTPGATLDLQAFNGNLTFGFPGGEPQSSGTFGSLLNNTTFNLLHINVSTPTDGAILALPVSLVNNTYLTSADVTNSRTVNITDKGPGTPFNFDNTSYNMDTINQTLALGAVEAWTIQNGQTFSHSFHIHDVKFKIISRSSGTIADYEQGWKDTVAVPRGESVTFVARFDDFADVVHPFMYHCHFSNHEDEGMMGQFLVIQQ